MKTQIDMEYDVVYKILQLDTKINTYERTKRMMQECKQSIDDNNDNENKYTGSNDPVFIEKRYNKAIKNLQESLEAVTKDPKVTIEYEILTVECGNRGYPEPVTKIIYSGDYYKSTKQILGDLKGVMNESNKH